MEDWTDIRERVASGKVSKREILRETGVHWLTLKKILTHSEPPGYRQRKARPKQKLGPYQDIIKSAAFMEEHALALQQAEIEGASAAEQLVGEMSAEDLKVASTLAEAHAYDLSGFATGEEREAYKAAAAQAAGMVDEGMGGMDEMPPEAQGEAGEQVSPEDILQVIEFLLSEGKISPEEAQKIVEELAAAAGGGEAGPEGGAPGGDPGAGGPPMEEDPNMPPEEKEARVKFAAAEKTFDQLIADAIK